MTYSIVARDPESGAFGVAVQSNYFAVGAVVPWVEAGVGAVATQASAEISYGPRGLERMRAGESAGDALAAGLSAASLTMAIWSALGVGLLVLMARQKRRTEVRPLDRAAAAASPLHTIPT